MWFGCRAFGRAARLGIEQDRPRHLEELRGRGAIRREHICDALYVSSARVARHQPLDQLLTNKGRDIGMVGDVVDGSVELLVSALPTRKLKAVQQCLWTPIVIILPGLTILVDYHGVPIVWHCGSAGFYGRGKRRRQDPPCEDPGKFLDGFLIIRRNRITVAIQYPSAVLI